MAGIAAPIKPLDSVANAMKAQQSHIQFRVDDLLCEDCANNRLHSAATKNADRPMSREFMCPLTTHMGLDAKTTADKNPARGLYILALARPIAMMVKNPVSAVHSLACQSPIPNTLNATAVAHTCSGGFSKYL